MRVVRSMPLKMGTRQLHRELLWGAAVTIRPRTVIDRTPSLPTAHPQGSPIPPYGAEHPRSIARADSAMSDGVGEGGGHLFPVLLHPLGWALQPPDPCEHRFDPAPHVVSP